MWVPARPVSEYFGISSCFHGQRCTFLDARLLFETCHCDLKTKLACGCCQSHVVAFFSLLEKPEMDAQLNSRHIEKFPHPLNENGSNCFS